MGGGPRPKKFPKFPKKKTYTKPLAQALEGQSDFYIRHFKPIQPLKSRRKPEEIDPNTVPIRRLYGDQDLFGTRVGDSMRLPLAIDPLSYKNDADALKRVRKHAAEVEKNRLKELGRGVPLSVGGYILTMKGVRTPYVDSHCHMFKTLAMLKNHTQENLLQTKTIQAMARKFFPQNCKAVVDIHCEAPTTKLWEQALLAKKWPFGFKYYFAVGVHPDHSLSYTDQVHQDLLQAMSLRRCVAWGSCGLDYFKNPPLTHPTQQAVFTRQLIAAVDLQKPLVIHTRSAESDTRYLLSEHVPRTHKLHIHCFAASREFARWVLEEYPNSFLGVTGVVSYELPHLHELIRSGELGLDRMLLETNSPGMVPENLYRLLEERVVLRSSYREDPQKVMPVCHSGLVPVIAEKVAELLNEGGVESSVDEVLEVTAKNVGKMYGIKI